MKRIVLAASAIIIAIPLLSGCATATVRNRLSGSPPAGLYPATRADLSGSIFSWRAGSARLTNTPNMVSRVVLVGLDLPLSLVSDSLYLPGDATDLVLARYYASKWTIELTSAATLPSGPCRIYNPENHLFAEGHLVAGVMDGTWTVWANEKNKVCELSYRNGVRHGPVKMWYGTRFPSECGRLKLEGIFLDGTYDGAVTVYYPSSKRRSLRVYEHGELKRSQLWAPDGTEQPSESARVDAARLLKADMEYVEITEYVVAESLSHAHRKILP